MRFIFSFSRSVFNPKPRKEEALERKKINKVVSSFPDLDPEGQREVVKKFSSVFEVPVSTMSRALRDLGCMANEISDFSLVPFGKGKKRSCVQTSGEGVAFKVRMGKNSFQLTFSHDNGEDQI